jgi:hypothetical protein
VDINFIFTKGLNLNHELLDTNRIFQIVEKIKQIAKAQLENGSKDIDYLQLVQFLQNNENVLINQDGFQDEFREPEAQDD